MRDSEEYEKILSDVIENIVKNKAADIMFLFLTDCIPELVDSDIVKITKTEFLDVLESLKSYYKEWFEEYENSDKYSKILSFYNIKKLGFDISFEDFWNDVEDIVKEYLDNLNIKECTKMKSRKVLNEKYDWIKLEDFKLANVSPSRGGVNGLEAKSPSKTEAKKWVRGTIVEYTPGGILRIYNKYLNKCYLRDNGDDVWYHN